MTVNQRKVGACIRGAKEYYWSKADRVVTKKRNLFLNGINEKFNRSVGFLFKVWIIAGKILKTFKRNGLYGFDASVALDNIFL